MQALVKYIYILLCAKRNLAIYDVKQITPVKGINNLANTQESTPLKGILSVITPFQTRNTIRPLV